VATRDDIQNLSAQPSDDGYAQQLAALAADKRRFLAAHHPIRDALNMALQQPAGVLLQRYADTLRAQRDALASAPDSDDPTERPASADLDTRPAIVAFTETQVAKAILGDLQAAALVSDRVEGKAGLRKADLDAETEAQRQRVRNVIGALVEDMVERRTGRGPTIEATIVDDTDTQDIDSNN
jgi:hypothetical protein